MSKWLICIVAVIITACIIFPLTVATISISCHFTVNMQDYISNALLHDFPLNMYHCGYETYKNVLNIT